MTSVREALAALFLAALGALFINVEPSIAAAIGDGFHLDSAALGAVLSLEGAGTIAGGCLAFVALSRDRARLSTVSSLAAYVVFNLATVFVTSSAGLMCVRALTGVAEGVIIGIAFAIMAGSKAPHRIFGAFGVVQTCSAIFAFTLLSWLLHRYGWPSAFVFLAIAGTLCFAALPKRFAPLQMREAFGVVGPKDALGLLSILVFFTSEAAIWPFLQRIGESRGVGDVAIAGALSFGAVCGLIGSATIMALPARAVGLRIIILTALLNVCAIAVLATARPAYAFVAALGLFNFAWAAFAPLQLSILRKLGAAARTFTLASTATTIGFALGPALGGMLAHSRGYAPAFVVGMLGTLIAVVLLAAPQAAVLKRSAKISAAQM